MNAKVELLKTGKVVLRNEWRGELPFDPSIVTHFYGVIVLVASFESFEWRELADEEWQRARIPIQVFSLFDLAELLRFVDTAYDFIVYLELREGYGLSHQMLVGQEVETFKEVLGTLESLWRGDPADGRAVQSYWVQRANTILMYSSQILGPG